MAVGPGRQLEDGVLSPMNVAVGDTVLLPEYGATVVEVDDEELFLVREGEILGKYE